jgi:hypothetical protein
MLKQVKAKPDDINTVSSALTHFGNRKDEARQKELRAHAARNADRWLAAEDKAFQTRKDSLPELEKAKDWLYHAGSGPGKARERAEQRGDTLAADEARRALETALRYYRFADKPHKQQQVKDQAQRLGDNHARKGEHQQAVDYYRIAGPDAKADGLEKKSGADRSKAEAKRQDQFKQDQKALEKELGL